MASDVAPFRYECTKCADGFDVRRTSTGFTSCRPLFEEVPCNVNVADKYLEGCAVCRRRITDSATATSPIECIKPLSGFKICNIGDRIRACYLDTQKYVSNNIQPIPFCSDYSFMTINAAAIETLVCKVCTIPYILDDKAFQCIKNVCFDNYKNCQRCSADGCSQCAIGFLLVDSTD
jgi:hypothetical protein